MPGIALACMLADGDGSVTAVQPRQLDHVGDKPIFVFPASWLVPLCGSILHQHPADPAL